MPQRKPPAPAPVEIDGQRFYIDPRGRGEYLIPEHAKGQLDAQAPTEADRRPGQVAEYEVEWYDGQAHEKRRLTCALEGCDRPARKRFCSTRHAHRFHRRAYARRQRGLDRWVTLYGSTPTHFERPFPRSLLTARRFFVEHISEGVCQYRGEDDFCPSVHNPYADRARPRCLIYAVYADDYMIWRARHSGIPAQRRYTTPSGEWVEMREGVGGNEATLHSAGGLVGPPVVSTGELEPQAPAGAGGGA